MSRILVVYGSTDGHTQKVAEKLGEAVEGEGCHVDVMDAKSATPSFQPEKYDAVIVAASVHMGGYQRAVRRWVRRNAANLNRMPCAFVSVCLGVLEKRAESSAELDKILSKFFDKSTWHPETREIVAGAIPYTRYSILKKWVMRRIARKAGGGTDVSRDYDYTDWPQLEAFARKFIAGTGFGRRRA